jgi:hypothetical protein
MDHARDLMNEKWGNLSVDAALDQMQIEMNAAKDSLIDSLGEFGVTPRAAGFQMERSKPRTATGGRPTPTDKDRDYARKHPEVRQRFIEHFGIEP